MVAPEPRYMVPDFNQATRRAIYKYDIATQAITVLAGSVDSWGALNRVDGLLALARFAQLQRLSLDGRGGEWTASQLSTIYRTP